MESTSESDAIFRVTASPQILWRAFALYVGLGLVLSAAFVGATVVEENRFDKDDLAIALLLWAVTAVTWSLMTLPWWWFSAGRTSYQVTTDELQVLKAGHLKQTWPRSDIHMVKIDGYATWGESPHPVQRCWRRLSPHEDLDRQPNRNGPHHALGSSIGRHPRARPSRTPGE